NAPMDRRPSDASKVCASKGSMICLVAGLDISAYCTPVGRTIKGPVTESGSARARVLPENGLTSATEPSFTLLYVMVRRLLQSNMSSSSDCSFKSTQEVADC